MEVIGIPEDVMLQVFKLVASILHIGNIAFVEKNNYAAIESDDCKSFLPNICRFTEYQVLLLFQFCNFLPIYSDWKQNKFDPN